MINTPLKSLLLTLVVCVLILAQITTAADTATTKTAKKTATRTKQKKASKSTPADPRPPKDATDTYQKLNLHGWTVRVSHRFKDHEKLKAEVVDEVTTQLRTITKIVKPKILKDLRTVEIWIEHDFPGRTQYHNSPAWLRARGYNPDKNGTVELAKAKEFLAWYNRPVNTMLHELAHAYHDQFLGWDYKPIIEAYKAAKASGKYDRIMRDKGYYMRHYAMNNHKEYFAECVEAYLWVNDYYPFVYGELKKTDPKGFTLVEKLWGPRFSPDEVKGPIE